MKTKIKKEQKSIDLQKATGRVAHCYGVSEAFRLKETGGITMFYGEEWDELSTLAECLAYHVAAYNKQTSQSLLEIVRFDELEHLNNAPKNLEVFVSDACDSVALVHADTTMACCRKKDLSIFSTSAPSLLEEDWVKYYQDCLAWQLIRDEAYALGKRVSIFLFSTTCGENALSHREMSFADNVIRVTKEDEGWLLKYIKCDSHSLRAKQFFIETQERLPLLNCHEIK